MNKILNAKFNLISISNARPFLFGIATFWVALFHSHIDFYWLNNFGFIGSKLNFLLEGIKNTGYIGVEIFLFLSGMGLYYSFDRNNNIKQFYIKRFFRIIPESLLVVVIYCLVIKTGFLKLLTSCLFIRLFIDGNRKFWFISLIIIMYLLYPLIHINYKKYKLSGFIVSLMIWLVITFTIKIGFNNLYWNIQILLNRIPIFLAGCYIAKYVKNDYKINILWLLPISLSFVLLYPLMILVEEKIVIINEDMNYYLAFFVALALVAMMSYINLLISDNIIRKFFILLGKYSIEFYLIFEKIDAVIIKNLSLNDTHDTIATLISFLITFILSILLKKYNDLVNVMFKKRNI